MLSTNDTAKSKVGGLLGVLLGIGGTQIVSAIQHLPFLIDPFAIMVAIGASALVGIVFGVYPALRAALRIRSRRYAPDERSPVFSHRGHRAAKCSPISTAFVACGVGGGLEGRGKQGRSFHNTEIVTVRAGKVTDVEVYFGWSIPHEARLGNYIDNENGSVRKP